MSFTGKPALQFKLRFIEAFNEMELLLSQRNDPAWLEARASGKLVRGQETDAIQRFIDYARSQGSQHAGRYYCAFSKLVNTALGIHPDGPRPIRDHLPPLLVAKLAVIEAAVSEVIEEGIAAGFFYRDVFRAAKGRILELAQVLTPSARLLAA
jgi:hypothetical protein